VWHAATAALRNPGGGVERLIWIYGTGMLAFSLFTSVLALWLNARFGVTAATIGWFFMLTGLLSLVMRSLLLGPVVDRLGEAGAMRLGTAIIAAGLILFVLAPSIWWFTLLIPAMPIGTALLFPATTSLISASTPVSELGTTMGVAQTFAGISRVLAPVLGTIAYQRLGIDAPFLIGGVTMAVVGYVAWRFVRPLATPAGTPARVP
jgi:MFS family permease